MASIRRRNSLRGDATGRHPWTQEVRGFLKRSITPTHCQISAGWCDAQTGKNGESVTADVLVCGTGFTQELPFLEESYRKLIIAPNGSYRLFRNIIHPLVPQLGFVGFNSSLFTTLTTEVAANWLVGYMENQLSLPSANAINEDMEYMYQWRRHSRPIASEFGGTCVAPFNFMHLDQLMKDMRLPVKLSRWPHEYLKPINPADYHKLLRGHKKEQAIKPVAQPGYQFY